MDSYKLVWDDFCAWYLEMVKPAYQQPIDAVTYKATVDFFERILKLLHPFMPFLTEELWHDEVFGVRDAENCCIVAQMESSQTFDTNILKDIEVVKQIVSEIRNVRNTKQISPKETLTLSLKKGSEIDYNNYKNIVFKLANISEFNEVSDKLAGAASFLAGRDEFYIPLEGNIDVEAEKEKIVKE